MALRHGRSWCLDHLAEMPIGEQDPAKIGHRIEAEGEKAEVDPLDKAQVFPENRVSGTADDGPGGGK